LKRLYPFIQLLVPVLFLLAGCAGRSGPSPEEATLTAVGDPAPDFTVLTLDGEPFTLSEQRGKVVLINWFATWCPPCVEEMPHLQTEVWERFRGDGLVMVSVARQETLQVVQPFVAEHGVTWPFALDPDRKAFAAYADAFIPRNHLVDREGTIVFQSNGFEKDDFAEMIEVIARELAADN
jgi:peroxiredoxin